MGIIEEDEDSLVSPQKNQAWAKPTIIRRYSFLFLILSSLLLN